MTDLQVEKSISDVLAMKPVPRRREILEPAGRTIIYGAGSTGRRVCGLLRRHGIRPGCFLDEKGGAGIFVDDIPVLRPDDETIDRAATVIVALFNHVTGIVPVLQHLERSGFVRLVPYTEFFLSFADELPAHYWLASSGIYQEHASAITKAFLMLADDTSREAFLALLRARLTGDPSYLPQESAGDIYFPSDIELGVHPERFIDCGAYTGDTLVAARARFGVLESVRAFEPDAVNYEQLVKLNNGTCFSKDTALFALGVWSSEANLRFAAQGSLSSGVDDAGDALVRCVALDDHLGGYSPTFIKMDIEGAELEALRGARRMITAARPQLAVSVYHAADHLWRIPLFIRDLLPGHKYFLRSHGVNGYDTVFYAYPG